MRSLRLCGALLVALLVVLDSGCGGASKPKPVAASGVLTYEDGKPVSEATVVFLPDDPAKGKQAAGLTGKDGSFTLTTYNQDDGAVPGDYKIIVTKGKGVEGKIQPGTDPGKAMKEFFEKNKGQPQKSAIPEAYTNVKSSPLKWRVESGGTKITLKLKDI